MKFKHGTRRRALEYEKDWVERWKKERTFEKSVENRPISDAYVFYDGPPFITGVPHHGTLLSSIVKDAVPRYWTMKGKRVERVWGWDCHGLPAENFVEKQLGIVDRRQIVTSKDDKAPLDKDGNELPTITLEEYIIKARESMVANSATWQGVIDRIGRWVDFEGAYRTMDKNFMESVWWAFKQLYEAGKIYEGEKVLMYDTKFATPVSKNEVTMDNDAYQTVTDPSLYAKFRLLDSVKSNSSDRSSSLSSQDSSLYSPSNSKHSSESDSSDCGATYVLAWTTTPWTLPANLMLAVSPELTYCEVAVEGEKFIVAEEALERVFKDEKHQPIAYEVLRKFPGSELVGKSYQPIDTGSTWPESDKIHKIYAGDFVSAESGTGIVHCAPAYGVDDFELGKANDISAFHVIDDNGYYTDSNYKGLEVWENNKRIAKDLIERGQAWKIEYIRHEYPFNPRSKQRIMYRAIPSWFFDTQDSKQLMLEQNENINWFPAHLKHGRFAKNIEQAPDWNLSRDRFWATAFPVWKGDKGSVKVVGSYAELKELSSVELEDYHRPWVDDITFEIDGEKFTRIDKVLDCWFESGSMPFAQFHYPFENKEKFEANFPGDFIVEYVGQVRAWFYYVHAVNTALADIGAFGECETKNAFKNVITTGTLAGNDGRKMSKSLGNFTDPNELMDKFSADSLRFLLLSSPLLNGEDFALLDKDVADVARKLTMIWNMYDFFTMYAEVDGWEFSGDLRDPLTGKVVPTSASSDPLGASGKSVLPRSDGESESSEADCQMVKNSLDRWIVSRLHQLIKVIEQNMDAYNLPEALKGVLPFLEDASNWYVRRSRRRFWKSEDDADKNQAYQTLHYVLTRLSVVLAPFTPFLAEELYQKMVGGESVHLLDWQGAGATDEQVLAEMEAVREVVNRGLYDRAKNQLKVRQPLAKVSVASHLADGLASYVDIIQEELNVKEVELIANDDPKLLEVVLDTEISEALKQEGLARELIRAVQSARKKAGLSVDDRINLSIIGLSDMSEDLLDLIKQETLAVSLSSDANYAYDEIATIEKKQYPISLEKA